MDENEFTNQNIGVLQYFIAKEYSFLDFTVFYKISYDIQLDEIHSLPCKLQKTCNVKML